MSEYQPSGIDFVDDSTIGIDLAHHEVHEGHHFTVSDHDEDVDTANPKYWLIKTPNTSIRVHMKIATIASHASLVELFENPIITSRGTLLPAFNNDRNSSNTATALNYADPTTTNDGTRIDVSYMGTNNPKTRFGGDSREQAEIVLRRNDEYLVKVTVENDNTKVTLLLEFYEHLLKNTTLSLQGGT